MRKNKFLTFLFALVPGCGHMYLGYMKRGAQYMAMFIVSIFLTSIFVFYRMEALGLMFGLVLPVIWFYQMFESMHSISHMKRFEVEFPVDDGFFIPGFANVSNLNALNFFKKRKVIKTVAGVLIFAGIYALFANIAGGIYRISSYYWHDVYYMYDIIMSYVPPVVISVLLIFAGIKLLAGSNKKNNNSGDGGEQL